MSDTCICFFYRPLCVVMQWLCNQTNLDVSASPNTKTRPACFGAVPLRNWQLASLRGCPASSSFARSVPVRPTALAAAATAAAAAELAAPTSSPALRTVDRIDRLLLNRVVSVYTVYAILLRTPNVRDKSYYCTKCCCCANEYCVVVPNGRCGINRCFCLCMQWFPLFTGYVGGGCTPVGSTVALTASSCTPARPQQFRACAEPQVGVSPPRRSPPYTKYVISAHVQSSLAEALCAPRHLLLIVVPSMFELGSSQQRCCRGSFLHRLLCSVLCACIQLTPEHNP